MPYRSLTKLAHDLLRTNLRPGDIAIDATAGNGHDTLFLARCVGRLGTVYAIDLQIAALQRTATRLAASGIPAMPYRRDRPESLQKDEPERTVRLLRGDHADLAGLIPEEHRGRVAAAVFNLGYLPGGDKNYKTSAGKTVRGIEAAVGLLAPGGAISIVAYRGHDGGREEYEAVARCLSLLADLLEPPMVLLGSDAQDSPVLLFSRAPANSSHRAD